MLHLQPYQASPAFCSAVPLGRGELRVRPLETDSHRRELKCSAQGPHPAPRREPAVSRRNVLLIALSCTLPLGIRVQPAAADRTGKFSTKLTAKRRYLPRIEKGFLALKTVGTSLVGNFADAEWPTAVLDFAAGPADDMKPALSLFATSYFSEGNKIGPTERRLKEVEEELYVAIGDMSKAAKVRDIERATVAYMKAVEAANEYIDVARLTDTIEPL